MKVSTVQTLRGLACLCLVAYHVVGSTNAQGMRIEEGWLRNLVDALAAVRMPVFGLIAGAMHGHSNKGGWQLIHSKTRRLLIPMFTVGTAFAVTQYFVPGSNLPIADLRLIHIVPVAHYWFLESLFLIFCLMALVESLWPIQSVTSWAVGFGLSALFYLFAPGFIWFSVLGATYLLPYFLTGFAMTRLKWDAYQTRRGAGLMLTLIGTPLVIWLSTQESAPDRFSAAMLIAGFSMSSGLWSLGLRQALLARIGDYSLAIFLFHVFFTSATRMAMQAIGLESLMLTFIACMVTGIAGPVAIERLLSAHPFWKAHLLGYYVPKVSQA